MLTNQKASELLAYDPLTGQLTWKVSPCPRIKAGDLAGAGKPNGEGYLRVGVEQKSYLQHRVIWLLVTGNWPQGDIDHADGDRANNRWANLRQASRAENLANAKRKSPRTGSSRGASYDKHRQLWRACVTQNRRQHFGGYFQTEAEAAEAAAALRTSLHGAFARHD